MIKGRFNYKYYNQEAFEKDRNEQISHMIEEKQNLKKILKYLKDVAIEDDYLRAYELAIAIFKLKLELLETTLAYAENEYKLEADIPKQLIVTEEDKKRSSVFIELTEEFSEKCEAYSLNKIKEKEKELGKNIDKDEWIDFYEKSLSDFHLRKLHFLMFEVYTRKEDLGSLWNNLKKHLNEIYDKVKDSNYTKEDIIKFIKWNREGHFQYSILKEDNPVKVLEDTEKEWRKVRL